jgi:hypothetical protein
MKRDEIERERREETESGDSIILDARDLFR